MGIDLGELKSAKPADLAVRFAFGAAISLVAGAISLLLGPHIGGIFLGAPAILPATLTLISKNEGLRRAVLEVQGAVIGGLGLIVFALVAAVTLTSAPLPIALGLSLAAWLFVSVGIYLARAKIHPRWRREVTGALRPDGEA